MSNITADVEEESSTSVVETKEQNTDGVVLLDEPAPEPEVEPQAEEEPQVEEPKAETKEEGQPKEEKKEISFEELPWG